ncbi:uncharacterized protein [Macaca fascicularis]|uniref:uncharacterized protein n=1 Tax=Macaca fascicularis TaxID=9541 RepID=UPI003D158B97
MVKIKKLVSIHKHSETGAAVLNFSREPRAPTHFQGGIPRDVGGGGRARAPDTLTHAHTWLAVARHRSGCRAPPPRHPPQTPSPAQSPAAREPLQPPTPAARSRRLLTGTRRLPTRGAPARPAASQHPSTAGAGGSGVRGGGEGRLARALPHSPPRHRCRPPIPPSSCPARRVQKGLISENRQLKKRIMNPFPGGARGFKGGRMTQPHLHARGARKCNPWLGCHVSETIKPMEGPRDIQEYEVITPLQRVHRPTSETDVSGFDGK